MVRVILYSSLMKLVEYHVIIVLFAVVFRAFAVNTAAARKFRVGFMVLSQLARAKVAVDVGLACGYELTI